MMNAAVLHQFGEMPRFEPFAEPVRNDGDVLVHVSAAALNPSTKLLASGQHYASPKQLPVICGVEGVGRLDDGTRVFFGVRRPPNGSMCQRTVVPRSFCWPVPDGIGDVVAAALPNPGLSSWLPLVTIARLAPGENVLILGATGVAGQLAIQIAKHLGAGRVVAAGRNQDVLAGLRQLGADSVISLAASDGQIEQAFVDEGLNGGFGVVLDYLWGHPTELLLAAMTRKGFPTQTAGTRLMQIGDSAGPFISLSAQALRSAGVTIVGSGMMPTMELLSSAFQQLMDLAARDKVRIAVEPVPLQDIETAWARADAHGRRLVIIP
jgi:NADPH:quinone reductase-like Zn-dependent oxidoreductase